MTLDAFWSWLVHHPNCVLRVGTPEAVVFDDDDLHWQFLADGPHLLAQVIRGKRLTAELVIDPERVAYVQALGEEGDGEFPFELISETEVERVAAWVFVMSHGVEEEEPSGHGRAVH